jgi:hypothetical protein
LAVRIYELRDGLIHRDWLYVGQPVTALGRRAHWVEREEPAAT